jgi:hypothetical protein
MTTITEAISRSQSSNERVNVEFVGDCAELLAELNTHIDSDTQDIDYTTENDGSVDVWALGAGDSSVIWRVRVTLVDLEELMDAMAAGTEADDDATQVTVDDVFKKLS